MVGTNTDRLSSVVAVPEAERGGRLEEEVRVMCAQSVEADGRLAVTGRRLRQGRQLGAGGRRRAAAAPDRRPLVVDSSGGRASPTWRPELVARTSSPVAETACALGCVHTVPRLTGVDWSVGVVRRMPRRKNRGRIVAPNVEDGRLNLRGPR